MPASQTVLTLIENFERNLDAYRNGQYNETQVRRDFIDPFFKALGWDMDNSTGYAEAYRDVIHEDAIKVGISTRAPDYSFRVGGQRKFFLEAKKPSVNVKDDIEPAFQLRRYAWSAKLPLSIVTDFEEFAVYDCRQKPDKNDKASKSRLFYCTFRDYAEKWDEIAAIFSKDAVLKGSFDKYASTAKGKRGTTEVDSAFLEEIEGWRDLLARNIALRNANLSQRELNFAVQQTIDRIIFLRICEDRGIEPYGKLMALQNGVNVYGRLRELFRAANGWITCTKQYVGELPIRRINFTDHTEKAEHDKLVALVEKMLALHQQLAAAKTPQDTTLLQRQIAATDKQIDQLVYALYGLTDEEIALVEGA